MDCDGFFTVHFFEPNAQSDWILRLLRTHAGRIACGSRYGFNDNPTRSTFAFSSSYQTFTRRV
jgi:hypothetical protein